MSRRRYISTITSTDKAFNTLGREHGDFAAMLYLLMIPHAEDDGSLTADPDELLATVVPMRRDKDASDVEAAICGMLALGLIERDADDQRLSFPLANFYKYQSYISDGKRRTPRNAEDQRRTAQNSADEHSVPEKAVLSSPSPSLSPSPSPPPSLSPSLSDKSPTLDTDSASDGTDSAHSQAIPELDVQRIDVPKPHPMRPVATKVDTGVPLGDVIGATMVDLAQLREAAASARKRCGHAN